MGKKRNDIVSFLYKVFPIYFPAGGNVLAKDAGTGKGKERRNKEKSMTISIIKFTSFYMYFKHGC